MTEYKCSEATVLQLYISPTRTLADHLSALIENLTPYYQNQRSKSSTEATRSADEQSATVPYVSVLTFDRAHAERGTKMKSISDFEMSEQSVTITHQTHRTCALQKTEVEH